MVATNIIGRPRKLRTFGLKPKPKPKGRPNEFPKMDASKNSRFQMALTNDSKYTLN